MCLDVDAETDRFMHERGQILLALTLPGKHEPSPIVTSVCYRSVVDARIYYGCHFDWQATDEPRPILEDLTEYTHDRFDQAVVMAPT